MCVYVDVCGRLLKKLTIE